jgi:prephenate dehydrogenase
MDSATPFARVAVLGTGLIGSSFALAARRQFPDARVTGWDREDVLRQAAARGSINDSSTDLAAVLRDADLIYVALPVGTALDMLPAIAAHAEAHALVTDAASTKATLCRAASTHFRTGARFLGGHPIAGKEASGVEHADADLFCEARYALIAEENDRDPRVQNFAALVRAIGGQPVWCDAETHDWAVGIVSHLPQLAAVALARVVLDEADETGLPVSLSGRGLRDLLRLAGSPYSVWRDVCLTNQDNIARALDRVAQAVDHLRTRLASRELESEFQAANELYKILHNLQ